MLSSFCMGTKRRVIEARAKALLHKRERQAAAPTLHRILGILNHRPPDPLKTHDVRFCGDPKTGMDYETLYECSQELGELMDSWLAAGCRLDQWPAPHRRQLEDDLNRRRIFLHSDRDHDGRVSYGFTPPVRERTDWGWGADTRSMLALGARRRFDSSFTSSRVPCKRRLGDANDAERTSGTNGVTRTRSTATPAAPRPTPPPASRANGGARNIWTDWQLFSVPLTDSSDFRLRDGTAIRTGSAG